MSQNALRRAYADSLALTYCVCCCPRSPGRAAAVSLGSYHGVEVELPELVLQVGCVFCVLRLRVHLLASLCLLAAAAGLV
jgi:hypothetical protein